MTRHSRDHARSAALDAYLARRATDGYEIETRTAVQAIIVRRPRLHIVRRLARTRGTDSRLVISVDEHGEVSAVAAEPLRW